MDKNYQRFINRIAYRGGKKKTIVALARKLATIIFCVLKKENIFLTLNALRFVPLFCPREPGKTKLLSLDLNG